MTEFEFLPLSTLSTKADSQSEFPIDAFPKEVQEIANELQDTLNFPIEYFLTSVLSAVATAIGNSCIIEVKKNYTQKPILYVALCGMPGVNKSAPLRTALKFFFDHDRRKMRDYKTEQAAYEKLEKKDEAPTPRLTKFIISNSTMEGIHRVHSENARGLVMMQDELAGFIKSQNMYRKGNDEEQWLSGFDGSDIIVDRKYTGSMTISNPCINIIGTIQPEVLKSLMSNSVSNGLLDRFLISTTSEIPEVLFSEDEPTQEIFDLYEKLITHIVEIPMELDTHGEVSPHVYTFSRDAKNVFAAWFNLQTPIGNAITDGINAKLKTYCARFCLILQVLKGSIGGKFPTEIEEETVNEAIQLCEYFKGTALQMREDMNLINPSEILTEDQLNLIAKLPEEFTTADALKLSEWTKPKLTRFLKRKNLFVNAGHGKWTKKEVL